MAEDKDASPLRSSDIAERQNGQHQRWNGAEDPDNPFNWPVRTKWMVTLIACYVTLIVGLNASSITAASSTINQTFDVSDTGFPNSYWPVTSWAVGAALAPMVVLPLMENFGMRKGYLISYLTFLVFVVPQARAPNFASLIVCRFIAGCCGGVLQDVMDGIIADIWLTAKQRSLPVTCYVFCLLAGVSLGPVIGGAVTNTLYWRWIFYVQLIIYGASAPAVFLFFKETRGPVILAKRIRRLQTADERKHSSQLKSGSTSPSEFFYEALVRPVYMLCTELVVFFFTLLSAFSYGIVFVSTQSVTQVFTTLYGWEEYQAGIVQSSIVVGELLGALACLAQNALYASKANAASASSESSVAESRLYLSIPASFVGLTGGLFWYGWTSYPSLPWVLPSIGLAFIGFGSMVVMQAIMMYVTDAYAKYAASASAAVCAGENLFAAFLPLAAQAMYTELGFQWASSLLAFVALALSFAPVALVIWGRDIRKRSPFMSKAMYE